MRLDVQNDIPLGVGLGSSSAAIVAGILLGSALCGGPLPPDQALALASEIEGHPDNVAAALHGGFVVAAAAGSAPGVLVAKAAVSENLNFVAVIPEIPLPTDKARAVLPEQYSRRDVVRQFATHCLAGGELFLRRRTLAGIICRQAAPALSQRACSRNRGMPGVSASAI